VAKPVYVAQPPDKPLLVYDRECNFCCFWIRRWQQLTGDRVEYIPFQDPSVELRFPELPRARFESAVQLIKPDGMVASGAEAVFQSLASNPSLAWLLWIYRTVPGAAALSEWSYGLVARHRSTFSILTRILWGPNPELPTYRLVRWMFLRGLGMIYLVAFVSLWVQVNGLIGSHGILPANEYMAGARQYFAEQHLAGSRFHLLPTWCWLGTSDGFLQALCAIGAFLALLLTAGVAPVACAALLWSLYLSLTVVGREFLSFQWDALLLETGFLAIFFAPHQWIPGRSLEPPVSRTALWLLRWLLFRLIFESGCVKLLSGDPNWRHLSALQFHYETQPLPTWIAWYAHHAPAGFQQACVAILFGIELALPFFIFSPRRLRLTACIGFVILQVWILLTGNYAFFNYLTILLTVLLLDDAMVGRVLSSKWRERSRSSVSSAPFSEAANETGANLAQPRGRAWRFRIVALVTAGILVANAGQFSALFGSDAFWWRPARAWAGWLAPFRSVNTYGLFAVMTTARPEIIIEGSNDRRTWLAYDFKYKPGPVTRAPAFVAPHQSRLDWQMWFAALGTPQQNPWFLHFCLRLLQGSPDVLRLLRRNPFPDAPPRYIRAVLYEYHFGTPTLRRQNQAWWQRELQGTYLPALSLRDFRGAISPAQ
jgi:lipase maturation factor 1